MIDDRLDEWSTDLKKALSLLSQGDVLEGLPFGYFGKSKNAAFQPTRGAEGDSYDHIWFREDDAPRFAIITSQTCDVCEEDTDRPRRPFILVSPVYSGTISTQNQFLISQVRVSYLRHLTGARFSDEFWIADLRIQLPFDKGVVVGCKSHAGFATEDEQIDFALQLAELYQRPVLPAIVNTVVLDSLRTHFGSKKIYRDQFNAAGIEELRISCTPVAPHEVQLFVFVKDDHSADLARACFATWYAIVERTASEKGIRLRGVETPLFGAMSAKEYRRTHLVSLRFLRLENRPRVT